MVIIVAAVLHPGIIMEFIRRRWSPELAEQAIDSTIDAVMMRQFLASVVSTDPDASFPRSEPGSDDLDPFEAAYGRGTRISVTNRLQHQPLLLRMKTRHPDIAAQ